MSTFVFLLAACGKKGAPLPPLQRVPGQVADLAVTRLDRDVFIRFTVPSANIDGAGPADLARVELYAITSDRPLAEVQRQRAEDLRRASTLVGAIDVRRPLPPLPPVKEGAPPVPLPPPGPGVDQGATVVLREALTAAVDAVVPLPREDEPPPPRAEPAEPVPGPLVAPPAVSGPVRYYYAVGISPRGRYGPISGLQAAPLGPTSSAPGQPEIVVEEKAVTISWEPPPDARGVLPPADPDLLPSRPTVPGPPPTMFEVYEVTKEGAPLPPANASPDAPARPDLPAAPEMPVVPEPMPPGAIAQTELRQENITLGKERCFVVRPVDIVAGLHTRGPASPIACATFADVFPPAPPSSLATAPSAGVINLIWEPSPSADVAGYLVLRAQAEISGALTPLMKEPVAATTYADTAVQPGVRYIYAVVAVDRAGNRSTESSRQEETARQ